MSSKIDRPYNGKKGKKKVYQSLILSNTNPTESYDQADVEVKQALMNAIHIDKFARLSLQF